MVHGSWLKAHGSCFETRGPGLMAHGKEKFGVRAQPLGTQGHILLGHDLSATSDEA